MKYLPLLLFLLFLEQLVSQDVNYKIYVYEEGNRGFVSDAEVSVKELGTEQILVRQKTNESGEAVLILPSNVELEIKIDKPSYQIFVNKIGKLSADSPFLKAELHRVEGYLFDITLAEERAEKVLQSDGIMGAQIEIYNRTKQKEELVLKDYPKPNFDFFMEKGNHYTFLIRREGYLAKRIEAYVNVEDCILCLDGISKVTPGVADNISATGFGTLLGNIELSKTGIGKSFEIKNINYDYDKWAIRPDAAKILDNVVHVFTDNPELELELGSHTDARGSDEYNLNLSEKRAQSAVNYLLSKDIEQARLSYRGYGETEIKNRCKNGVTCTDKEHEENRRTELKITGIRRREADTWKPLSRLITEEEFQKEMFKDVPGSKRGVKKSKGPYYIGYDEIEGQEFLHIDGNENNGKFVVIAGSFLISSHADKHLQKLINAGFSETRKVILENSEYYSIIVDSFNDEKQALALVKRLKMKKIEAFVKSNEN